MYVRYRFYNTEMIMSMLVFILFFGHSSMLWIVSYITNYSSKIFYEVRAINHFLYDFSFAFMLANVFPTLKSNKYFPELLSKYSVNNNSGHIYLSNVK